MLGLDLTEAWEKAYFCAPRDYDGGLEEVVQEICQGQEFQDSTVGMRYDCGRCCLGELPVCLELYLQ